MPSPHRTHALACYALSQSALPLAQRLAACLAASPWNLPGQPLQHLPENSPDEVSRVQLFAPARFCPAEGTPFDKIGPLLAQTYPRFAAHAFIGATGIAVRALAPLLKHKSIDAPVLVLDPAGTFALHLINNADRVVEIQGAYRVTGNKIDYRPQRMFFDGEATSFARRSEWIQGTVYLVNGKLYFNYAGKGNSRERNDAMNSEFRCVAERVE